MKNFGVYAMSKNTHEVVLLVDKFYKYGGGEIWLEDVLNNIENKIKFKCIISIEDPLNNLYQKFPIPVYKFSENLAKEISKECDILLFWGRVLDYPKFFKIPIKILMAHSDYNVNWFLEKSQNYADYSIACSTNVQKAINLKKCSVIWPGLDRSRYLSRSIEKQKIKEILGFNENDFIVGQFCRFAKFKNIPFTIEAISKCPSNVKLLLIGHGEMLGEVLSLCEKKLHNRFQHIYYCDTKNISNFYSILDLFCLPSLGEGYARVQWESMMFEVPFAGTNVGGVGDGIDNGENGFVIKTQEDILNIIEKLKNKEYNYTIIKKAKKYFEENGTIESNIKKIVEFINKLKYQKIH